LIKVNCLFLHFSCAQKKPNKHLNKVEGVLILLDSPSAHCWTWKDLLP